MNDTVKNKIRKKFIENVSRNIKRFISSVGIIVLFLLFANFKVEDLGVLVIILVTLPVSLSLEKIFKRFSDDSLNLTMFCVAGSFIGYMLY